MLQTNKTFAILYVTLTMTVLAAGLSQADTIQAGSTRYENVYVVESDTQYYISLPEEGRVVTVPKSDDESVDVTFSREDERRALYQEWKSNRSPAGRKPSTSTRASSTPRKRQNSAERRSGEYRIPEFTRDGVPVLKLKGQSRPRNPEVDALIAQNIRRNRGGVQTENAGPARRNPSSPARAEARGGGRGGGGGGGGGGGRGGGGGGGGGGRGGGHFTNISALFGTFDDTQVGETRAIIGYVQ